MDQIVLVGRRIEDGRMLLLQLHQDGFEVAIAFWLKAPDDAWPHLFIASRVVQQRGPAEAYRALESSLERLPGTSISLAVVKLLSVNSHITSGARRLLKRTGAEGPVEMQGGQLSTIAFDYLYIYPPVGRHRRSGACWKVRLKSAVDQVLGIEERVAPLSLQEGRALEQIVASGASPNQAAYWVREKRKASAASQSIPAGTVVDARLAAWWGKAPEDDPNPLLEVTTHDGRRGLTFRDNTEPFGD